MGHRAFLVKQVLDNSFEYIYSHWGANKFQQLTDEYYHSENEVTDEDIENRFNKIWSHSEEKGEDLRTAANLDEIVDVENISIEAYIIQTQENQYHVILPTINAEINVAVTKPVKSIPDLHHLRGLHRKVSNYIRVAQTQGLDEDTIRDGVRKAVTEYRRNGYTQLLEENDSVQRTVFQRIGGVIQ